MFNRKETTEKKTTKPLHRCWVLLIGFNPCPNPPAPKGSTFWKLLHGYQDLPKKKDILRDPWLKEGNVCAFKERLLFENVFFGDTFCKGIFV